MAKSQKDLLKVGEVLSETQYYKIQDINAGTIIVKNERGFAFTVSKNIVEEGMFSASQVIEEKKVTRTELIEIFNNVGDTVFTVCFHKQPSSEDINEAIESANKGKIIPIKELKKLVKDAYKGKERILTGYLIKTETGFGRSMVIDLMEERGDDPNWDARIRQVDHRTLNWLITKNIKYSVK